MATPGIRRPLRSRDWPIIRSTAKFLADCGCSPNQISIASIGFAALAAICFVYMRGAGPIGGTLLCWFAAIFILGRMLCNLLDGLVAVEAGRGTKSGELFNDIPDRIADPLILIGLGYALQYFEPWALSAGWCAGLLAVMTAYVRTLSCSLGAPADFRGPMAKPHRMILVMVACLIAPLAGLVGVAPSTVLLTALVVIIVGCLITIGRRAFAAYVFLENRADD